MDEDTRLFPEVPNAIGVGILRVKRNEPDYKFTQILFFDDLAEEMASNLYAFVVNTLMDHEVVSLPVGSNERNWEVYDEAENTVYYVSMTEYGGDPIDYYHEFLVELAASEQLARQQLASKPAYKAGEGSFLLLPDGTLDKGDFNEYYRHNKSRRIV